MAEPIIEAKPAAGAPGPLVKEANTATFMADVVDGSRDVPVIVDFWATWCGPCKQLGPVLEKVVNGAGGKVRLVKIDVDKNPDLAQQLRIQSIPAVIAFADGRPVDAFAGALPESQVKQFIDRVIAAGPQGGAAGPDPAVVEALEQAKTQLEAGDAKAAAALYARIAQHVPDSLEAIAGLIRASVAAGDIEGAKLTLAELTEDEKKDKEIAAAITALQLAEKAAGVAGDAAGLQARVAADPT